MTLQVVHKLFTGMGYLVLSQQHPPCALIYALPLTSKDSQNFA